MTNRITTHTSHPPRPYPSSGRGSGPQARLVLVGFDSPPGHAPTGVLREATTNMGDKQNAAKNVRGYHRTDVPCGDCGTKLETANGLHWCTECGCPE